MNKIKPVKIQFLERPLECQAFHAADKTIHELKNLENKELDNHIDVMSKLESMDKMISMIYGAVFPDIPPEPPVPPPEPPVPPPEPTDDTMFYPFYYYIQDTGDCNLPTKERIFRMMVDPNDLTKVKIEYIGNYSSTSEQIYRKIYLNYKNEETEFSTHVEISVKNGKLSIESDIKEKI